MLGRVLLRVFHLQVVALGDQLHDALGSAHECEQWRQQSPTQEQQMGRSDRPT
jgi:hypothetical protein